MRIKIILKPYLTLIGLNKKKIAFAYSFFFFLQNISLNLKIHKKNIQKALKKYVYTCHKYVVKKYFIFLNKTKIFINRVRIETLT